MLRTSNGGEYIFGAFKFIFLDSGIVHQTIVPYTPKQNSVAERKKRNIMECVYSMLTSAKLPNIFQAEAMSTTIYLQNILLTSTL